MKLLVIGVNHKTAPIAMREKLAFSADEVPTALSNLHAYANNNPVCVPNYCLLDGCIIVSTCNRTEIYVLIHTTQGSSQANTTLETTSATSKKSSIATTNSTLPPLSINTNVTVSSRLNSVSPKQTLSVSKPTTTPRSSSLSPLSSLSQLLRPSFPASHPAQANGNCDDLNQNIDNCLEDDNRDNRSNCQLTQYLLMVQTWLANYKEVELKKIQPYLYQHQNANALTHWIRVAAGLDSMILGEPQILGQIKQAVANAMQHYSFSNRMGWVVDQIFSAAKQVRHDTQVGAQAVTLGFATAKLATQIFDDITKCTLLVVAAGEMNRLVASHIAGLGVQQVIICNRSNTRANELKEVLQNIAPHSTVTTQPLTAIAECLPQADIVSSCSGSMQTLINFAMVKAAIKKRRYRPMLLVDLAVPRDIEEKAAKLDDVYLYSVDDLQHVIAGNLEQRQQAAVDAEILVSQLVIDIDRRYQIRQVGSDIQVFRQIAQQHAEQLLKDALQQVEQGNHSTASIMTELTRKLTQTLTHPPSTLLRKVASEGDGQVLAMVVQALHEAYRD